MLKDSWDGRVLPSCWGSCCPTAERLKALSTFFSPLLTLLNKIKQIQFNACIISPLQAGDPKKICKRFTKLLIEQNMDIKLT